MKNPNYNVKFYFKFHICSDFLFIFIRLELLYIFLTINFVFRSRRRFPRAWLQSPRHYVPAGLSAQAIPAGVAIFHFTRAILNNDHRRIIVFSKERHFMKLILLHSIIRI